LVPLLPKAELGRQLEVEKLMSLDSKAVFCAKVTPASYIHCPDIRFPELPAWAKVTTALIAFRSLLAQTGLDHLHFGSPQWNPLGAIIREGEKIVVKPNWVHHQNLSSHGMDCLVTHTCVVEAILHYVAKAHPEHIIVGDAPIQGCDFRALMVDSHIAEMIEQFTAYNVNVSVKDFRRTVHPSGKLSERAQEGCRPVDEYILYDLGSDSSLEAITSPKREFRVTMYNPDLLNHTHRRGRHQYLIARDVIEADVVINVPKLKTHKKACITGALKNLVGINGHKEYLPHHRKGGSQSGGDCYPGRSRLKSLVEDLLDATNRAQGTMARRMLASAVWASTACGRIVGVDNNYEGAWYGNDTVWRMSLDLQRVLHYGRADGTLTGHMQRTVLTVTDAIIAGQGDGPLAPTPIKLGIMTLGANTAATEWVHALLMGLDPQRIPLTREAFVPHRYPLTNFSPSEIVIRADGRPVAASKLFAQYGCAFCAPSGWRGLFERSYPTNT
jgi:uncharacterized protein (DUF362 family)